MYRAESPMSLTDIKTTHMMECSMVQLLKDFCHENDVPYESADELVIRRFTLGLTREQVRFLNNYSDLWEAMNL